MKLFNTRAGRRFFLLRFFDLLDVLLLILCFLLMVVLTLGVEGFYYAKTLAKLLAFLDLE